MGRDYFVLGQYDQAIEQYNKTREIYPNLSLINLGPIYERKGMFEQAIKEHMDADTRSGIHAEQIAALRQAYMTSGWRGYWQKRLDMAKAEARRKPIQSILLAELYTHLSEKDQALAYLQEAYKDHNMSLIFLKVDPTGKACVRTLGLH